MNMERRAFLGCLGGAAIYSIIFSSNARGETDPKTSKILGMYVHCAWPYRRPYASRAWTIEDWRGYADGLKKLGFNTIIVWPVVEIMPLPQTPSDRANIERLSNVVDMLHEMGFKVYMTLCPNIMADDAVAAQYSFEERHYFETVRYVDPADYRAIDAMVKKREELMRPLAKMDGLVIIDSDTGSFPGAKNDQFVNILVSHRKMLDRLRPGIELLYWMHVGWEAYGRYHASGKFEWASFREVEDLLSKLKAADLAPWGISVHSLGGHEDLKVARKLGIEPKAVYFNYGAIEGEPTFPMSNFGGSNAFEAGKAAGARGVVGNAQTHCLQLPNTFCFARGFAGRPVNEADFVEYADRLIAGCGRRIVDAWKALASEGTREMRDALKDIEASLEQEHQGGDLKGLLFGSPTRFLSDLLHQLRFRIAGVELVESSQAGVNAAKLKAFVSVAEEWQAVHGYQCMWNLEKLTEVDEVLKGLKSPVIDRLLAEKDWALADNPALSGDTSFERHQDQNRKWDTHTVRVLRALKEHAARL